MELHELSLSQAAGMLAARQVSSLELTQAVLERQAQTEPLLNCFITATPELALAAARQADERRQRATPLSGIPLGLQDCVCLKDVRTTAASRLLHNFVPPYDATIARRLIDAGMVLVGKQNMDDLAMGGTTESSFFGPAKNPWDTKAVPGGAAGGSAASLAAGSCLAALACDNGGSIRQPASHCGVVGLKPTYGLVSRAGVIGFAGSLEQAGPMGREVEDVALLLQNIAGFDELDQNTVPGRVPDYSAALKQGVKGLRLGLPEEYFNESLDSQVREKLRQSIEALVSLGVRTVPVSLPHTKYLVAAYAIIAAAESSSILARYDGVKFGFQGSKRNLEELYLESRHFAPEAVRRIMLGAYVLSSGCYESHYLKACQLRTLISRDFGQAWQLVDAIAAPAASQAALNLGDLTNDPLELYLRDIFTVGGNLAGLPAISLPAGFNNAGRPIGMQLLAPHFKETTLLSLGAALQSVCAFHQARPRLTKDAL